MCLGYIFLILYILPYYILDNTCINCVEYIRETFDIYILWCKKETLYDFANYRHVYELRSDKFSWKGPVVHEVLDMKSLQWRRQ